MKEMISVEFKVILILVLWKTVEGFTRFKVMSTGRRCRYLSKGLETRLHDPNNIDTRMPHCGEVYNQEDQRSSLGPIEGARAGPRLSTRGNHVVITRHSDRIIRTSCKEASLAFDSSSGRCQTRVANTRGPLSPTRCRFLFPVSAELQGVSVGRLAILAVISTGKRNLPARACVGLEQSLRGFWGCVELGGNPSAVRLNHQGSFH